MHQAEHRRTQTGPTSEIAQKPSLKIQALKNAVGSDTTRHGDDEDGTNRTGTAGVTLLNEVTCRHREDTGYLSTQFLQTHFAAFCTSTSPACTVCVSCATHQHRHRDLPRCYLAQVRPATTVPPAQDTSTEQRLQLGSAAASHRPAEGDREAPNWMRALQCKVWFAGCAPRSHVVLLRFLSWQYLPALLESWLLFQGCFLEVIAN